MSLMTYSELAPCNNPAGLVKNASVRKDGGGTKITLTKPAPLPANDRA